MKRERRNVGSLGKGQAVQNLQSLSEQTKLVSLAGQSSSKSLDAAGWTENGRRSGTEAECPELSVYLPLALHA